MGISSLFLVRIAYKAAAPMNRFDPAPPASGASADASVAASVQA
jgi:hypothetical protein